MSELKTCAIHTWSLITVSPLFLFQSWRLLSSPFSPGGTYSTQLFDHRTPGLAHTDGRDSVPGAFRNLLPPPAITSISGHNFHLHSCFPLEGLYSAGMSVQQCNTALFSFSLFSTFTLICRSLRRKLAAFFQWEESASPCWVSCSVTDVYFHVSDLHVPSLLEPHKFYCVLPWHPPKPFLFALSQRPLVLLFLFSFLSGNFQLTLAPASLLFCWL